MLMLHIIIATARLQFSSEVKVTLGHVIVLLYSSYAIEIFVQLLQVPYTHFAYKSLVDDNIVCTISSMTKYFSDDQFSYIIRVLAWRARSVTCSKRSGFVRTVGPCAKKKKKMWSRAMEMRCQQRERGAVAPRAREACLAGSVDYLLSYLFDSPVISTCERSENRGRHCTYTCIARCSMLDARAFGCCQYMQ